MNLVNEMLDRHWTHHYTCQEFVCEAWQKLTGENLENRLMSFLNDQGGDFEKLDEPISPCIVLLKLSAKSSTHVGLFFGDKVLHLALNGGQHLPLEILMSSFKEVSFYR